MKLYDIDGPYDIAKFEGGKRELAYDGVYKSFNKAKKIAIQRLQDEIDEMNRQMEELKATTEETCIEHDNT